MKSFSIKEPVFNTCINVVANCDIKAFNAFIRKHVGKDARQYDPEEEDTTMGINTHFIQKRSGKIVRVIWLRSYRSDSDLSFIVHELFHATMHIADHLGIGLDPKNHEALAYLYEFYFDAAQKNLHKAK
jgi:hypothetical protein